MILGRYSVQQGISRVIRLAAPLLHRNLDDPCRAGTEWPAPLDLIRTPPTGQQDMPTEFRSEI
jgi:hypothetical protein